MADVHDKQTRSFNMSRIKGKDTKPEMLVRKFLFARGWRYRLHDKRLAGKPDMVFPKLRTVVFIHGCYWHGHENCRYFVPPKTRTDWWLAKIGKNKKRDAENLLILIKDGWKVITVFECELKSAYRELTLKCAVMPMRKNLWTRDELIATLNLYLKLPYGKMHAKTLEVVELAKTIGRTPGSISRRLGNFAHVDPYHQQRGIIGLANGRRQVEPIWNEFINNQAELLFESEKILAEYQHKTIEVKFSDILAGTENLKGETKIRAVKTRVNQNIFRQIVLVNYSNKCAITAIDVPELLIASHIIPWAQNENERLNPENGICLSPTFDKCFDKGFIGIDADYKIRLSRSIKEHHAKPYFEKYFKDIEGMKIHLPLKYLPRREFLDYHLTKIFKA